MRANEGALVAFDAILRIPLRNLIRDRPFLGEGGVVFHRPIEEFELGEFGSRDIIAIEFADDVDVFIIVRIANFGVLTARGELSPSGINLDLAEAFGARIDGFVVQLDDVHTFLLVGHQRELLHPSDRFIICHDGFVELEEGSLQGGVGVTAHPDFGRDLVGVNDVHLGVFGG